MTNRPRAKGTRRVTTTYDALLVGGLRDGEHHEVSGSPQELRFVVEQLLSVEPEPVEWEAFRIDRYELAGPMSDNPFRLVYVFSGTTVT